MFSKRGILNRRRRTACLSCGLGLLLAIPGILFADPGVEILLAGTRYHIELANTPQLRQTGLMHRQQLGPRQGMLLVYPGPGERRIWMKNVPIVLQVYWIDADSTVIGKKRLPPCSSSPCPVYSIDGQAQYVLELGDYDHPLQVGDRIEGLRGL